MIEILIKNEQKRAGKKAGIATRQEKKKVTWKK